MALARNTAITFSPLSLPALNFPFEQLYASMLQTQQDYDLTGALSSKIPNYLERDSTALNQYKDYTQAISNEVTNAFASGDTQRAMRMLSAAKQDLSSQWQPGGLAYGLQDRYDSYQKGIEELKKAAEKDPTALNMQYGLKKFSDGIGDIEYDAATGKYNRVGTAQAYNYTDINKRILENVNAIDPTITEQDVINGMWVEKIKKQGYEPERIRAIIDGVFSSPDIQQQIEVNTYGKTMNMTPDQIGNVLAEDIATKDKEVKSSISSFDKLSITNQQKALKQAGYYTGRITGKRDNMTKEAIAEYKAGLNSELENMNSYADNPEEWIKQKYVVQPLKKQFSSYLGTETSNTLNGNEVAMQDKALAHKKALQDREFAFQEKLLKKETESGLYTPSAPVDIEAEFKEASKLSKQMTIDAKKELNTISKDPVVSSLYGTKGDDGDFDKLRTPLLAFQNSANLDEFAKNVKLKPEEAKAMYLDMTKNAATYKNRLVEYDNAKRQSDLVVDQQVAIYKDTAGDIFREEYEKARKAGKLKREIDITDPMLIKEESLDQFIADLIVQAGLDKPSSRYTKNYQGAYNTYKEEPLLQDADSGNRAKDILTRAAKQSGDKIKAGYVPKVAVRYRGVGTDPDHGFGRFQKMVTEDVKAGNLTGYADARTGNRDEFTTIGGKKISMEDLNTDGMRVIYESGVNGPEYIVTAKSLSDDKTYTVRLTPPDSHDEFGTNILKQEFAIAANQGNDADAAKAARFLLDKQHDVLAGAGAAVVPTNRNIKGEKLNVNLGDKAYTFERPYTTSYSTSYGDGHNLEIVTYEDKDGRQKWATTLVDDTGKRTVVGKPVKEGGTYVAKKDHTNIADMMYSSYDKALDGIALYKAAATIPIDKTYESIPKDLRGLGLGQRSTSVINKDED